MEVRNANQSRAVSLDRDSLTSNSDFETFLKMLTTQVQNQDPLSPLETSEFANQLAAFTMVEQQTLTNQRLNELLSILDKKDVGNYASMVGQTTVHEPPFYYSGQPVSFEIIEMNSEEAAKIVVIDATGNAVSQQVVGVGAERVEWSGRDFEGGFLNAGTYSAQLRSVGDDRVLDAKVGLVSTVEEVRFDPSGVKLLMGNGSVVSETAILKLR